MDQQPAEQPQEQLSESTNVNTGRREQIPQGSIVPDAQLSPPKKTPNKKLVIGIFAAVLLLVGGTVSAIVINKKKPVQTPTLAQSAQQQTPTKDVTQKQVTNTTPTTNPSKATQEDPYTQQAPESLTTFYDGVVGSSDITDNSNVFITVSHPKNWTVFRRNWNSKTGTYSAAYIEVTKGKYLHIAWVDGVGGDCQANTDGYTLVKKLPTQDSELFFTEYTTGKSDTSSGSLNGFMSLEGFGSKRNYLGERLTAEQIAKHESLKAGEGSNNTCVLASYPYAVGKVMIALTDSNKPSFKSNVKWSDIQDDADIVAMLQSLKVYKK
jgi:hypothetical protein